MDTANVPPNKITSKQIARFLLLVALAMFTLTTNAQECLTRTWKGTVGLVPVMIEFDDYSVHDHISGRYYYRKSLDDLLLFQDDLNPGRWKEIDPGGTVTGYLTVTCTDDTLTGEWESPDGSRTRKIFAKHAPQLSYDEVRLHAVKPVVIAHQSSGSHHHDLLEVTGNNSVTGIRLIGDGSHIAKINEALRDKFIDDIEYDITCITSGRLSKGESHGYFTEATYHLVAWNKAFVLIRRSSSWNCGGPHYYFDSSVSTYNLNTGDKEDVTLWLDEDYRESFSVDSSLGEIIMKHYRPGRASATYEKCQDKVRLSGLGVLPGKDGMEFQAWTSYAAIACSADVVVPYKKIAPFLSPRGKAGVRYFQ